MFKPLLRLGRALLLCFLASATARAQPSPMTYPIILVRHAEKSAVGGSNPPLSAVGEARAQALAGALAQAGIKAVLTSPYQRTQLTAQPLAQLLKITPQVVDAAPAVVAAQARLVQGAVLVVGHSNTVPGIIAALGGPQLPDLPEDGFSSLFILLPGNPPRLIRAQYGATSP